jgi:hypothetical protein
MGVKRRLLDLLTVASLLLCVAVASLWVRSHFVEDQACWTASTSRRLGFISSLGRVKVWHSTLLRPAADTYGAPGWSYSSDRPSRALQPDVPGDAATGWNPFGIGAWDRAHGQGRYHSRGVLVGYWLPAALLAVPPALWLWRLPARRAGRARSRSFRGLCPGCGYDLRGTPERCPECGADASVSSSKSEIEA